MEQIIGAVLAIAFIAPTMWLARRRKLEFQLYAGFLIALPLFYMGFGALAGNVDIISQEALYGVPYFVTGLLVLALPFRASAYVLGVMWMAHGGYDLFHDHFFVNPGVWGWYPVFCAVIDGAFGSYLIYLATRLPGGNIAGAPAN